jgi:hypothetical protein
MVERRVLEAGFLYSAAICLAGFVLGALRVAWIAPLAGDFVAVALEAPVLLAIAWAACGWTTERLEIPERFVDRLAMGAISLALLLMAEIAVSLLLREHGLVRYLTSYSRPAILLGLVAQLGFALFPLLRTPRRR